MIAVIDYGMGNLRSVCKALEHVAPEHTVRLAKDPAMIRAAERVVFPGQGAIGGCMRALDEGGLRDALVEAATTKPFLGICLGLQALFEFSEEGGGVAGLGLMQGRVPLFRPDTASTVRLKVPHMGWNEVQQVMPHPLWHDIPQGSRFYFVHSYYAQPATSEATYGTTEYGISFTSAAAQGNIFAVQFHPEKSQLHGLTLLKNFCQWDGTIG